MADEFTKNKPSNQFKRALVKGIPRQAVLKPAHALYRLQNQHFEIGDRVTMIQDSGSVPLSVKGVVVGLNAKSMDVVWDVPFMSGGTLGNRYLLFLFLEMIELMKSYYKIDVLNIADRRWSSTVA